MYIVSFELTHQSNTKTFPAPDGHSFPSLEDAKKYLVMIAEQALEKIRNPSYISDDPVTHIYGYVIDLSTNKKCYDVTFTT